jgi:hypothetical protein
MRICAYCGAEFTPRRTGGKQQLFCRNSCAKTFHNNLNNSKRVKDTPLSRSFLFGRIAREKTLSERERQILIGTLLGDGGLIGTTHKHLSMSHGIAQKDWLSWKVANLPTIFARQTPTECKSSGFGNRAFYAITSVWHPYLDALYAEMYGTGRKRVTQDAMSEFTDLSLAVWYQDDGSINLDPRSRQIYLCTDSFVKRDVELLATILRERFSLKCGLYKMRSYHRIYISRRSLSAFIDLVRPYIHPCLAYKAPDLTTLSC